MIKASANGMRYMVSMLRKQQVHVNLQLLYTCNFKCRICDFWKPEFKDAAVMTLDQIGIVEEKLRSLGPQIVSIGGGEPLLHPDIVEIVRVLSQRNFPVMICNGWYITPELCRELFDAGMYEISISVDYADPKAHDRQRGIEGAFDKAVAALETLQRNRTAKHQRVHMISVVMDDNIDDIEPLIQLARDIGVTYLVTLYSDNRGKKDAKSVDRDISQHLLDLKKRYDNFLPLPGYIERFSEAVENRGISPCYAGRNLFNIDSQGDVNLCIDFLDDPVGNILSDDMATIQRKLNAKHKSNTCQKCWTSCRGTIETLMYGKNRLTNMRALGKMVENVPLTRGV